MPRVQYTTNINGPEEESEIVQNEQIVAQPGRTSERVK